MSDIITAATPVPIGNDKAGLPSELPRGLQDVQTARFSNNLDQPRPISIIAKSFQTGHVYSIPHWWEVTLIAPGETKPFNLSQALAGVQNPIELGVQVHGGGSAQLPTGWSVKWYNVVGSSVLPITFDITGDPENPDIAQAK